MPLAVGTELADELGGSFSMIVQRVRVELDPSGREYMVNEYPDFSPPRTEGQGGKGISRGQRLPSKHERGTVIRSARLTPARVHVHTGWDNL